MAVPETYMNLAACASDLGWAPGHWPDMVTICGVQYMFHRKKVDQEGDLLTVIYRNVSDRRELTVFND